MIQKQTYLQLRLGDNLVDYAIYILFPSPLSLPNDMCSSIMNPYELCVSLIKRDMTWKNLSLLPNKKSL